MSLTCITVLIINTVLWSLSDAIKHQIYMHVHVANNNYYSMYRLCVCQRHTLCMYHDWKIFICLRTKHLLLNCVTGVHAKTEGGAAFNRKGRGKTEEVNIFGI